MNKFHHPVARLNRLAVIGLLGSTAASALQFWPVFGLSALLPPVLIVLVTSYCCVELSARWPRLATMQPLLVLLGGVLGVIETVLFSTTVAGLPTVASLRTLWRGLTEGWLLTLQSTWPARSDAVQLLFVPLTVLLAVLLGIEILSRLRAPVAALLPSLVVIGLAQVYQALNGATAVLAAACYLVPAALLLWADHASRFLHNEGCRFVLGSARNVLLVAPTMLIIVVGSLFVGGLDPVGRGPYRLKDSHGAPLQSNRIANPLHEIPERHADPAQEVFRYRSDQPVDRWTLVTLNRFDGVNWSMDARLYRMGKRLKETPGSITRAADVNVRGMSGPWLPSQSVPLAVDGVAPLVAQSAGALLLDQPTILDEEKSYRLVWSEPQLDATALQVGSIDTERADGLDGLGAVPAEINQLAKRASQGVRPTFQSALQLESFLAENYQVALAESTSTGHGWPQLQHFLLESRRGTSEQFAAAYVVLARLNGIPARLVVGYRGSTQLEGESYVVRNRDMLAWPEVAVAGVGWVPLDPTAVATTATQAEKTSSDLAEAVAQARSQLPLVRDSLPRQQPQTAVDRKATDDAFNHTALVAAIVLSGLLICWLGGVPLLKAVRAGRRRRRAGTAGVVGAWAEVCDQLRSHGAAYRSGMTPRDLARSAALLVGNPVAEPIQRLGRVLDSTLWSDVQVTDEGRQRAWVEVRAIRHGLAQRPILARLRAAADPLSLLPPGYLRRHVRQLLSPVVASRRLVKPTKPTARPVAGRTRIE